MALWMRGLTTLSFVCFASLLFAQENAQTRIARASALKNEGNWRSSVALLEPLVEFGRSELTPQEALVAWNLLALDYRYLACLIRQIREAQRKRASLAQKRPDVSHYEFVGACRVRFWKGRDIL